MDIKERILVALGLNKEDQTQLAFQAKTEDGTIIVSTAEELEAGVDISVLTEDGTTILLPVGTYKLNTGVSFRVEKEGIVSEVMESETEEEIEAKEDKEDKEEMTADEAYEKAEFDHKDKEKDGYDHEEGHDSEADVADLKGMEKRIKNLEDAIADIKETMGEGDGGAKEEDLSKNTVEEKVEEKVEEEKTELSATEEIEKLKAENEKLKTELSETPADSPLNTNKFSSERPKLTNKQYSKLSKQEKFIYNLNKY
tara:strand:+ start:2243 stop:3007 length:765 start_codon:yes stop_codon:yes gene_type:complete